MIPEGWHLCAANDLCHSISVGIVIKPSQYYVSEYNGIKAFRSANVREGIINNSNWVYLSQEGHDANKKSQLKENDVLIVRTGYPGTACVVTKEFEGSNAIDIVIARPDQEKILPQYLCAFTNSEFGKAQVLNLQGGMAQKHLNVGAYKSLLIKLPTVKEQKRIAKILSTWDKAIETVEKLIENSRAQKKALMQQLLTGKKRFAGFEGEWDKVELGKLLNYTQPTKYLVKSTEYSNEYKTPVLTAGKTFVLGYTNEDFGIYEDDSTVIIFDDFTTASKFVDFRFKVKSSAIKILTAKPGVDIKYVFEALQMLNFKAGGHQRHWISIYSNLVIKLPNLEEQQKIASVLTNADKEIELLKQQLSDLKQEKKALMQQLLTGKRRVTVETTSETLC